MSTVVTRAVIGRPLQFLADFASAAGDKTLLAAPSPGLTHRLVSLTLSNQNATPCLLTLRLGATAIWKLTLAANAVHSLPIAHPHLWPTGANNLVLNLSAANIIEYSAAYYLDAA
jgi:hypothetical protein